MLIRRIADKEQTTRPSVHQFAREVAHAAVLQLEFNRWLRDHQPRRTHIDYFKLRRRWMLRSGRGSSLT